MAWTVALDRTGPNADSTRDNTSRAETLVYVVTADNDNETEFSARSATGLPAWNSVHPNNTAVRARRFTSVRRGTSKRHFTVSVGYIEVATNQDPEDPLSDDVIVDYERSVEIRPYNRALFVGTAYLNLKTDGTSIMATAAGGTSPFVPPDTNTGLREDAVSNSAKDEFDPAPEKEINRVAAVITKNYAESVIDYSIVNDWQNAVNTQTYLSAMPGTLKLGISISGPLSRTGVAYRAVTFRMDHRVEGWDEYLLDAGYNRIYREVVGDPTTWTRRPIVDEAGNPKSRPELLDGNGNVLTPVLSAGASTKTVAVFRVYRPYENRRAFAALGLGI